MAISASDPTPHPIARRAFRAAAIGVLLGCAAFASAWGPEEALARPDGARAHAAADRLHWAEDDLARVVAGFGAKLSATPGLSYGADVEDPAEPTASLALATELRWTWDEVDALAARIAVARAADALGAARRLEGKASLELLGDLLRARLALEAAEAELREASDDAAHARRGGDPIAAAHAELDLREAELGAADARADVAAFEWTAAKWGFVGEPSFAPVRFALPLVDPVDTPGYRILALEAARAAARADRAKTFGVLRDLELAARWESRTDRYQLDASIGLPGGRSSAAIGAAYGPQQDDQWHIRLTARVAIDDGTARDLAAAERAAERAVDDLGAWVFDHTREAADARRLARLAGDRLDIALERLRTRELEARDVRARGADPAGVDTAVRRDRDRVYLAWLRYVEEVDDYLEIVGAPWEIAGSEAVGAP